MKSNNFSSKSWSDLFCEDFGVSLPKGGVKREEKRVNSYDVIFGETDAPTRKGRYATIECGKLWEARDLPSLAAALTEVIRDISDNAVSFSPERILIAAFGNGRITADSIGSRSADFIVPSQGGEIKGTPRVTVIKTGVPKAVGIDSSEVTSVFASHLSAQLILCIDALAASTVGRLGSVIQVTDAGIAPGSGISPRAAAVSSASMGIPVVSVGVPTVIRDPSTGSIYTCAEAELLADRAAAVVAGGINGYLYGKQS